MKRLVIFSLFMAVILSNCTDLNNSQKQNNKNGNNDEIGKVIDPALINSYWVKIIRYKYNSFAGYTIDYEDVYKFTNKTLTKGKVIKNNNNIIEYIPETTIDAYCKNKRIYSYDKNAILLYYELNAYPDTLDADILAAEKANSNAELAALYFERADANNGKIIKITTPDNNYAYYKLIIF